MSLFDFSKSVLQPIELNTFLNNRVQIFVKRDDLIDELVSGNKWRKLKYSIENALALRKNGILTLGGAWSNHLIATAAACHAAGMSSIGIVRGEELNASSNVNLQRCTELGMKLIFISREEYAERNEPFRQEYWKELHPDYLFVPEGGADYHGVIGCQELGIELNGFDHVFVAQGTTTTSCGILLGLPEKTKLHVVPALKGFDSLSEMKPLLYEVLNSNELVREYLDRVVVHPEHHFGGYGKWTNELLQFIERMKKETGVPLDKIYTGKAFYAMCDTIERGELDNSRICFVHTGGLMNG